MKLLSRVAIAGCVALLAACQTDDHASTGVQGDLAGWAHLPVDELVVIRQGERHVVSVRTATAMPGWTVRLVPWSYEDAPHLLQLDLVGRRAGEEAEVEVTSQVVSWDVTIDHGTRWIQVTGSNGDFKSIVPWLPAGVSAAH